MKTKIYHMTALLLALSMVFSLVGCSSDTADNTTTAATTASAESTAANTEKVDVQTNYPEKDITVVWSSGVGSGGDLMLRELGEIVNLNGHSWIVENRKGGNGVNAWSHVVDQPADGYTLMGTSMTIATNWILGDSPYSFNDFDVLCGFMYEPVVLYCNKDQPFSTLEEFMSYCKDHPGEVTVSGSSATSSGSIALHMLLDTSGVEVIEVAYNEGVDTFASVLGGHCQVATGEWADIESSVASGDIKCLCLFSEERIAAAPDVVTAKELGYDVVVLKPRGIAAPKGLPEDIKAAIIDMIHEAVETERFQNYIASCSGQATWVAGDDFLAVLQKCADDAQRVKDMIQEAN